ncbi:sensor histidine kinase [Pseudonocardia humida]|uniref:histidine kinase n=1 Tax=Pseudonocardia humida TaxID=2800819 RepID=A0ABT0ZS87_9PSEU|nr:nitrate- and nitrite sensing domain-containing protein [Pseudonocardia humida]MCO1653591.1 nitrate- and nitrite sensing domain-containing protein [Pseudonocardia humida]
MRKDQRPSPGGRPDRIAPRNWSLRTKLAIVLAVPAVLAVVLGGLRIVDQVSQADELDRVSRFIAAQGEVSDLVALLQQERLRATEYVTSNRTEDVGAFESAGQATDQAGAAVRPAVEGLYADDAGLVGAHRQADQALARLPGLRTLVTTSNAPPSAVISRYGDLIGQIVQLDNALLRGVNTAGASGLANALTGLTLARNEASLQESLMNVVARSPQPAPPDLVELQSSQARLQQGLNEFRGALDAGQRVRYAGLIAGPTNNDRVGLLNGVLAGSIQRGPDGFDDRSSAALYDAFLGELDQADDGVRNELTGTAAAARQSAVTFAGINAVVLVLALLIGATVVGLIARQMIRSLRTLRRGALEVADARLPDAVARMRQGSVPDTDIVPVAVDTREEIGQVARAFDAVHAQAVRLAAEQATLQSNVNAMFVNLSRRSQTLVDRQLKLIEELEAGEEDPDQLSNLFRLDHLATRMRRNSENLLVLAGTDLGQRSARPVPAIEVLQAAVSEVEQYRRVVVQSTPDLAITGRVSNDLQHLLAELLENATNFSPPESRVVMTSSRTADGALLVEITDEGVGMSPAELAQLNDQLRKSSDATVEASRRMGLFVVGRLAARHGIDVGLFAGSSVGGGNPAERGSAKAGSGLTARVWLPRQHIAERHGAAPQPAPPSLPQRIGGQRDDGQFPRGGAGQGPGRNGGAGSGTGGAGVRPGQSHPAAPTQPTGPLGGALPVRSPRPAAARNEAPEPFRDAFTEPESRPRPAPAQRTAPQVESVPQAPGVPAPRPERPSPVERPVVEAVAVDLPPSQSDSATLFAAQTPPAPLPDPFAAERPRDPFAQPDPQASAPLTAPPSPQPSPLPTPQASVDVPSGWFRVVPPAVERAAAAAASAEPAGRAAPLWEEPGRDRTEHSREPVGDTAGSRSGGVWEQPAPRPAPAMAQGRSWPEAGEPGGRGSRPGDALPERRGGAAPPPRPPSPAPHGSGPGGSDPSWGYPGRQQPPTWPPREPGLPEQRWPEEQSRPDDQRRPGDQRRPDEQRESDFATAADQGWRAAEAVRGQSAPPEVTAAGLPRRTPLARLVPGSAATTDTTAPVAQRRDAEAVRGRLASYQRGVRSGRESRERSAEGEQPAAPPEE